MKIGVIREKALDSLRQAVPDDLGLPRLEWREPVKVI
jgi:hypothetical protein